MLDVSSEEITDGNLPRALLLVSTPLVAQSFVRIGEQVVDLFWIGRLNGDAVAGIGLAAPVFALVTAAVIFAPAIGTQVLVSQRVGAGDGDGARRAAFNGVVLAGALAVVGGGVVYLLADPAVEWLASVDALPRGSARMREYAVDYLRVLVLGLGLATVSDGIEYAFVGHGDSKTALYMNVIPVAVDVALDPFLIFGYGPFPRLEVEGAALATVVAWSAGLAYGLALVARGRRAKVLSWGAARLDVGDVHELLDIGLPTAGQQLGRQVARFAVIVVAFGAGGAAGVAAYYVGARVATVSFVPAAGLQQGLQSVAGQNLGADEVSRADRATVTGVAIAVVGLTVVGLVQWFVPGTIVDVLAPALDGEARGFTVDYLKILAYGYPAIGAAYLLEGGFNGARRTRVSFVATLLQFYAVRLPVAVAGAFYLGVGVHAVFWAVTLSNVAAAVGLAGYYRYSVADGMFDRAVARVTEG